MATVSSHILNAVDGTHAAGVAVRLINLGTGETLFDTVTDAGGRLKEVVSRIDRDAGYELTFDVGAYWVARGVAPRMREIVLRFGMPDDDGTYHSPIIASPNGYSVWASE